MAANWKQKYLTTVENFDNKEKNWAQVESVMRMGITRIALAAQGVDERLDSQLKHLRKAIRSGNPYIGLDAIVSDISESVKRIDTQRNDAEPGITPPLVLNRLISALALPKTASKSLKAIQKALKSTTREDQSFDKLLRELAQIINDAAAGKQAIEPDTTTVGFLGRLFSTSGDQGPTERDVAKASNDEIHANNHETDRLANGSQRAADKNQQPAFYRDTFKSLLDELKLPEKYSQQLASLNNQLISVDGSIALQKWIEQLVSLITRAIQDGPIPTEVSAPQDSTANQQTPSDTGLSQYDSEPIPEISVFCLQLIEALHFPSELQSKVLALRDQIADGIDIPQTAQVLNGIADLIAASRTQLEKEKQDLQDFLRQITDRLQDIDQHLAGAEYQRQASVDSNHKLDVQVEVQVKGIETSVNNAAELSELKTTIQQRLEAIRTHWEEHRSQEEQYQLKLKEELANTNSRLHDLEQESQQLKLRLSEEHTQATHDSLTGIHNRLAYEERIEQEYARWKRYNQPLALLIFDIDHFKKINDTWGHRAGDKALRLIAKALKNSLRETDFVARYGGEEFVVLMPETGLDAALVAANKLREAVAKIQFHYQERQVSITVSCGVSLFQANDSKESVFQRADESLYQAKKSGRNRCCVD